MDVDFLSGIIKVLYFMIVEKYNIILIRVERVIRYVIEILLIRGKVDIFYKYFGYFML